MTVQDQTKHTYSKYDRFCLGYANILKKIGSRIENFVFSIIYWCEDRPHFCWTGFGGTVGALLIAFANMQNSFLITFAIAEGIVLVISVFMLFYDRAEMIEFIEYCNKGSITPDADKND